MRGHPKIKSVIPLCPEPILEQDCVKKNDCEQNAALRRLDFAFIIGAKDGNHKSLFEHVCEEELHGRVTCFETTDQGF